MLLEVQRYSKEIQKSYQYVDNHYTDLREQDYFICFSVKHAEKAGN